MRMPLFRGMKRWSVILSGVILSSLLLAACGGSPAITDTRGPVANREAGLFWLILGIAAVIFVLVEAALIYSVLRFRARPNTPAPKQLHGNDKLELAWTIVPALFLFGILYATISTMFGLAQPPGDKLEVRAYGRQWWWQFEYMGAKVTTADTLHVPAGTTVQVDLYSDNVIHSFWVPQLTGKTDVIPGHGNHLWFKADQAADKPLEGACAEFCGDQHAHMRFNVKVDTPDEFQTWLHTQQAAAVTPSESLAAQGQKLFSQGSCAGCHGIVGVNLKSYEDPQAANKIGPNLTHFGSRNLIAGGVLENTPENLSQWLHDPQTIKPGNDMPNLNLSDNDVKALAAYLESIK